MAERADYASAAYLCTRLTLSGRPCKNQRVRWPENAALPQPQACHWHITPEEAEVIKADREERERLYAVSLNLEPACWGWPPPTEELRAHVKREWAHLPYPVEGELLDGLVAHAWHQGRCAICGENRVELVQDHDHQTGLERGLLCRSCNTREGVSHHPIFERYRQRNPASICGIAIRYWHPIYGEAQPLPARERGPRRDNPMRGIGL